MKKWRSATYFSEKNPFPGKYFYFTDFYRKLSFSDCRYAVFGAMK
jgi:hypothetical protein